MLKTLKNLKKRFATLNPLAIFYYFCLTVIVVRGSIMLSLELNHIPAIYFRGWHLHHFIFGFLCLVLVVDEFGRKKMPRWVAEILLGIAFGLIFDEFAFWSMGRFDYWSVSNFFAMLVLSIAAGVLSRYDSQPYHINFRHRKTQKEVSYWKKYSFKKQVILPWASFAFVLALFFLFK